MVNNALGMLVQELKMQQSFRTGQNPKDIHFNEATLSDLRVRATFASKASLILEFVRNTEGIEVSEDDIEAKYQELADSQGQSVEAVKGWFTRDGGAEELRERILEEKTLDWLLERQTLVEVDPAEQAEAEQAQAQPAETPAKSEAAPSGDADTSVLNQAIGKLKAALATGDYDGQIAALIAAEEAGKARKGALDALKARA